MKEEKEFYNKSSTNIMTMICPKDLEIWFKEANQLKNKNNEEEP